MSNRVEKLKSRVAELQTIINELTEEPVEIKERLHQLEDVDDMRVPPWAATRRDDWETEGQADVEAAATEPVDADETSPIDTDETRPDEADGTDRGNGEAPDDDITVA